jgi:hypothetical protein
MKQRLLAGLLVGSLYVAMARKSRAEDFADAKFMYYAEEKGRIKVLAPTFMLQHETFDGWAIKMDGIYNSISGATPTGAPPAPIYRTVYTTTSTPAPTPATTPTVSGEDHDEDGEDEDEDEESDGILAGASFPARAFSAITGATPAAGGGGTTGTTSSGGSGGSSTQQTQVPTGTTELPMADFSDSRFGLNLGVSRRLGNHTPGTLLSFSRESDYLSLGASLQDAVDFNKRTTTLTFGGAYTHDTLKPANGTPEATKKTVDLLVGIRQVITPTTFITVAAGLGKVDGFLSDPYKVVSLNGTLVPERRPDTKDKQTLQFAVNQFITPLDASIEASLRHYSDSFGISSETLTLAWLQKLGPHWILAPMFRYYDQKEADFYDVTVSGNPEYYSADYRISAFSATSYGLQLIWSPSDRWALDIGYERYSQTGKDGKTPQEAYVDANIVRLGARWNF